jgi:hypothetical protein
MPVMYERVIEFMENDDTYKSVHSDDPKASDNEKDADFKCLDFAIAIKEKANSQGIRCAVVTLYLSGTTHVLNAMDTIDCGMVYIEPQGKCTFLAEPMVGDNLSDIFNDALARSNPEYDRPPKVIPSAYDIVFVEYIW